MLLTTSWCIYFTHINNLEFFMSTDLGTATTRPTHAEDPKELLNVKLDQLRERREKRSRMYKLYVAAGATLLGLSPFLYFIFPQRMGRQIALAAFAYGVFSL